MLEETDAKSIEKSSILMFSFGILGLVAGISCAVVAFLMPGEALSVLDFPVIPSKNESAVYYSDLTGVGLTNAEEKTAPAYCIQTPNGTDGARPQAGLNQAGVVFEAIAESGITRFAAIYQQPTAAVIGPIRSLRLYYLQWDTPFDCTIVHAGGADDALEAVRDGGYKDLSESYTYMYRGTYGERLWNNLFTNATDLAAFSSDHGYNESHISGFSRMTPDEAMRDRVAKSGIKFAITEPSNGDTSVIPASTPNIAVNFGGWASFNVRYNYDGTTNTYLRSYETGAAHEVYVCPGENLGEVNPEDYCTLEQLAPTVVAVIVVDERRASDNYHEDFDTVGSGEAYIFQNGYAVKGTWKKSGVAEQIRFYDADGVEIALAPGQTFIEAVPRYGSVEY